MNVRCSFGVRGAMHLMLMEVRILIRHILSILKWTIQRKGTPAPRKIHLGCGRNIKVGWLNIDYNNAADLAIDLRRPLPLDDESVDLVYAEHFLEHLEYPDQCRQLLMEILRVLSPGQSLRLGVPDTEWPLHEYASEEHRYFDLGQR
ncbi:hypothetical protein RA210_U540005 [Rubrivivax sp. A210]|uniref:class I SAM-dependent methyltransferase n=1 Tax=Rubrivivax sp. A210 TaxID=2772301 RepID=UPI001918D0AD|nr:methyltransferase domain-containing protein [Rubrivivax sp. A210]CAD5374401.1 hypothetical protein RA210_U540005 [Rubrivivax sp. A210]